MFDFQLRHYKSDQGNSKLRIHKISLFDIFNISPINSFEKKLSWKFQASFNDFLKTNLSHSYGISVSGASGLSYILFLDKRVTVYGLLALKGDLIEKTDTQKLTLEPRLSFGPEIGIWSHVFSTLDSIHAEFKYLSLLQREKF